MNLSNFGADCRKHFYALALLWLILQLYFFLRFGIVSGFEAQKYIDQAQHLILHGYYTSENFIFYSTEILLIAISIKTGIGYGLVVFVQLILNALSVLFFYKTIFLFTRSYKAAFIFTAVFLSMFYYHLYNVHLFTESLYFSFTVIYTFILFSVKRPSLRNYITLLLCITLIYFTRPTGIFFLPATIIYFLLKFYRRKPVLLLALFLIAGLGLFLTLLNSAMKSGGEFDFLLPYTSKMIICGVPTIQPQLNLTLPVDRNTLSSLWYIITNHTSLFFELAFKRMLAFWGVMRPYYSLPHNLFIAFYFYGIYLLVTVRLKWTVKIFSSEAAFFFTVILLVMCTALLSCDEWHNRFILSILPFLLYLSCIAFSKDPRLLKCIQKSL